MKYKILTQISEFLSKFNKISTIKRVGDLMIAIKFDGNYELIFDLNKSYSSIYKSDQIQIKEYKAPFDILLKKRLNSAKILSIKTLPNNRILAIKATLSGSYKEITTTIYLEFTGRFTNAIICDENGVILEALHHFDNDTRSIKVGKILTPLDEFEIREKPSEIIENFDNYFIDEFHKITLQNLNQIKANKIANLDRKIELLNSNLATLETKENLASTKSFPTAVVQSYKYLYDNTYMMCYGLYQLFTGKVPMKDLHGIVAITKVGGDIIENNGIFQGLLLIAIISMDLALVNFLPIPALDGGHLLFLFIEKIHGKRLDDKIVEKIGTIGFMFLVTLMVYVIFNDVFALLTNKF